MICCGTVSGGSFPVSFGDPESPTRSMHGESLKKLKIGEKSWISSIPFDGNKGTCLTQ